MSGLFKVLQATTRFGLGTAGRDSLFIEGKVPLGELFKCTADAEAAYG